MKNFRKVDNNLYRSAKIDKEKYAKTLKKYNISLVIDLRTDLEIKKSPDILPKDIEYLNISLISEKSVFIPANLSEFFDKNKKFSIYDAYEDMSKKDSLYENANKVLKIIDEHDYSKGAILFHCSQGKDRTGVIAALYLEGKNINKKSIYKDYLKSNKTYFNKAVIAYLSTLLKYKNRSKSKEIYNFFHLKKEYIEMFLDKNKK